jgi:hypothetical protein
MQKESVNLKNNIIQLIKLKVNTQKTAMILAGGLMFAGNVSAAVIINQDFDGVNNTGFTTDGFSTYTHVANKFYSGNDIHADGTNYGWKPGSTEIKATETVDLTTLHVTADIDAGKGSLSASAWIAGYEDNGDHGALQVSFFTSIDGSGTATSSFLFNPGLSAAPDFWLGSANASGVADLTVANTSNNWSYFSNTVNIATGTRSVTVDWLGYRNGSPGSGGSNGNDAYVDDILVTTTVPEPSSAALLGLGGLALLMRRRK